MKSNREGKPVSVDEAVSAIPNHGRVYVAQGSGCPYGLLVGIDDRREMFESLEFVSAFLLQRPAPIDHLGQPFRWLTLQATGAIRDVLNHPYFGIVPGRYSDLDGICAPGGSCQGSDLSERICPICL